MAHRNGAGLASAATDYEARRIVGTGKRDRQSFSQPIQNTQAPKVAAPMSGSAP